MFYSMGSLRFIEITNRDKRLISLIKQYALERLFPGDTDAGQAWQELKALLGNRINDGLAGKVSTKSIGEILDEELAGDRT